MKKRYMNMQVLTRMKYSEAETFVESKNDILILTDAIEIREDNGGKTFDNS